MKSMFHMSKKNSFYKRLLPLAATQTLGVYNDNAFKALLVFIAIDYAKSYSQNSFFLALMTIVFVAPFIIFTVPAGFCADRFSKKRILVISKFSEGLIMLMGALLLAMIGSLGIYPLIVVLFLMAGQSSFFSPALNSVLPEIFTEDEISSANGILVMLNFIAVIVGFSSGVLLKVLTCNNYYMSGIFFTLIGVIGFIFSLFILKTKPIKMVAEWNNNVFTQFFINFKLAYKDRSVFTSILGEALFYGIGASLQTVIILFARFSLGVENDLGIGLLQIVIAIGIAIGCWLAGRLSRNKLELGLVAIGSLGMCVFIILTGSVFDKYVSFSYGNSLLKVFPNTLFFLAFAGVFGGIFVLPLKVCQQERTNVNERGRILAISNFCSFFVIFISGIVTYVLTGKSEFTDNTTNHFLQIVNRMMFSFSPETAIFIIGFAILLSGVLLCILHREFLYRAFAVLLTRTLYNIECFNLENFPSTGPMIITSNHITLIDPFLITSCFSRQVTFVLHENFEKHPIFKFLFLRCGFLKFPDPDSKSDYEERCESIREVLKDGGVICFFPEEGITKDGMLGRFGNTNFSDFCPRNVKIPIIPLYIGNLWGSIFSYYFRETGESAIPGKFFWKVSIAFGEEQTVNIKPSELKQYLSELSASLRINRPIAGEKPIHYHFLRSAKSNPLKKVITEYGGKSLSSISLLVRSMILSKEIRKLNDKNKYIGIMLPNCNAVTIANLAIMFADKVPAFLNFTLPKESLIAASKQANLQTIITSRQFILRLRIDNLPNVIFLEDIAAKIGKKEVYKNLFQALFLPSRYLAKKLAPATFDDVLGTAILLFSSGSSGTPKAIMLSHHNINTDLIFLAKILACKKNDKMLGNLPLFHSFGLITCFWMPLMLGVKVVYIKNPLEINAIVDAIRKYKLTMLMGTPTFFQGYMKKLNEQAAKSLRLVISGAEKLRMETADAFYEKFKLYPTEGYGCTELSPVVSVNVPESISDLGKKIGKKGSIGRSMPGIAVRIVDPDSFTLIPPDSEGLLLVKGPNIMQGYLDKVQTEKVIIDGWYNTGDMAKMDKDGYITITGRLSRFSKIGGEMISHQMLENAIHSVLNAEERKVAVAGAPDKIKGEKILVFYTDENMSVDDVIKGLIAAGTTCIAVPKKGNFKKIDELPLLGTGKLDLNKINSYALKYSS
jgi:acyl-[acyl-carrier-protein]-phospholipid O-acyltransferase / long-chain-fatty-acid--[acyl-carrier-protein] ligase